MAMRPSQLNNVQNMLNDPQEEAKMVARKIMEQYDHDGTGFIDHMEVCSMISDAYSSFNKEYQPNKQDIDNYIKNISPQSTGRLSYDDILEVCQKYLCK